jgi:LacI family transcriptional regulator
VQHLLEQGYQKVGIITGPLSWWEARERETGWQEMMAAAGVAHFDQLRATGDWTAASGYKAMTTLLDRTPDVEAVFVSNDSMALGALRAASSHGRSVPHDLALVGFDDIPESAFFSPPLTTVKQGLLKVGQKAVNMLHQNLQARRRGESLGAHTVLIEPQLIVRESSMRAET